MVDGRWSFANRTVTHRKVKTIHRSCSWCGVVLNSLLGSRLAYNFLVPQKTNAARLLEQLRIPYELREYEVDPDDLAAEAVAAKIGLPPEQVFKTLVARGDRHGIVLAVIPGDQELDLKALAAAAEERKIQLVPVKELQSLTGYIRGGVTALAAKRDFPVFVDETIELFDVISISAGIRGLQIFLAPADYLRATHARLAALGHPKKTL